MNWKKALKYSTAQTKKCLRGALTPPEDFFCAVLCAVKKFYFFPSSHLQMISTIRPASMDTNSAISISPTTLTSLLRKHRGLTRKYIIPYKTRSVNYCHPLSKNCLKKC